MGQLGKIAHGDISSLGQLIGQLMGQLMGQLGQIAHMGILAHWYSSQDSLMDSSERQLMGITCNYCELLRMLIAFSLLVLVFSLLFCSEKVRKLCLAPTTQQTKSFRQLPSQRGFFPSMWGHIQRATVTHFRSQNPLCAGVTLYRIP